MSPLKRLPTYRKSTPDILLGPSVINGEMSTEEIQEYKLELQAAFFQLLSGNVDCAWLKDTVELNLLTFDASGHTEDVAPQSFSFN